jgi:DNA invertase Pin-like site-specific DNA recombinase
MTPVNDPSSTKVTAAHLERRVYVYVRQSSPRQVENNLQSQQRQYEFAHVALQLGWAQSQIVVIDDDQGQSGSRAHTRSGFGRMVTAVGLGEVGIVMSLEASRLARNSPDWHNLIYMSRYTDTLIADEHGIYDPSSPTDRMVLGLRGQMSEMELETSIHRMMAGRLHKAQRGEFLVYPPAGYDVDDLDRIVMTSDEAVAQAIRTVFAKFDEFGTVKQVCGWWEEQGLKFPVRRIELRSRPIVWMDPVYRMLLYVLHHPIYAGAYVFGRTKTVRELDPDDPRRLRTHQRKVGRDDWPVLIHDHHPGYIQWAQFEQNQRRIRDNQQMRGHDDERSQGPVREGWALLQGLARCGHCGRTMYISYGGSRPSPASTRTLQYRCCAARKAHGGGSECQVVGGKQINDVVVDLFLAATQQAGTEAAQLAVEQLQHEQQQAERMWQLQLEKAEYEAQRAERQYNAVEPENRLVARNLEARWNAALSQVEQLKTQALHHRQQIRPLSEHEQARARRLATDLQAVWQAETTTNQDRKQLLVPPFRRCNYAARTTTTRSGLSGREVLSANVRSRVGVVEKTSTRPRATSSRWCGCLPLSSTTRRLPGCSPSKDAARAKATPSPPTRSLNCATATASTSIRATRRATPVRGPLRLTRRPQNWVSVAPRFSAGYATVCCLAAASLRALPGKSY